MLWVSIDIAAVCVAYALQACYACVRVYTMQTDKEQCKVMHWQHAAWIVQPDMCGQLAIESLTPAAWACYKHSCSI